MDYANMHPSAKKVEQMMVMHMEEGPRLPPSGESRFDMRSGKPFLPVIIIRLSDHATFSFLRNFYWRYETWAADYEQS